jgi:hypothetical protein
MTARASGGLARSQSASSYADLFTGAIVVIEPARIRVRSLPISGGS